MKKVNDSMYYAEVPESSSDFNETFFLVVTLIVFLSDSDCFNLLLAWLSSDISGFSLTFSIWSSSNTFLASTSTDAFSEEIHGHFFSCA